MNKSRLYFVALIPPEPILSEVKGFKEQVATTYNSKAALRSPAHITLHMPFQYREDREEKLWNVFQNFVTTASPFEILQDGFGCFEPRVIYVNVEKSAELDSLRSDLVKTMRRELNLDNADYKNLPFHPHMTIAFRDLKKTVFPEAWGNFEKLPFKATWKCHSFCLLKHTGKIWLPHKEFIFQKK